ncbi:MAG: acyl-CoA thioesterase [Spirochaetaceae bacterium]|nr:acyl-CoA thioesterase [Spirochaetaceae bacterium]
MKHRVCHVVRTYECDSYGHVNNAVYLNYLEYARREFLTAAGFDYRGLLAAGYLIYITHIDIHYRAQAVLDDRLIIEAEPLKLRKVSGVFRQRVLKEDGTVCADAEVTWACVNRDSVPHPIPPELLVPGLEPDSGAD